MKKTKIVTLFLVMAVLNFMLVACGGGGDKVGTSSGDSVDSEQLETTEQEAPEDKDTAPITLTVFNKDNNPNWDNYESLVAQQLKEKTGVTLKMEYPTGELSQKVALMIAGDDYPDMMFVTGSELDQIIRAGGYIDLTDLIEEHGPNIKNMYVDYIDNMGYSNEDPSIYTLPTYGVDAERWVPNMGFQIQHDAIKEAGYPELRTLEEAEKVIADYVKKHPEIDGQSTIGLSFIADDWRWKSSVGNMGAFVTGKPDDGQWYIDTDDDYKAHYRFTLDDHKEYYRWLNHMNDIGLLDPEAFTQNYDQYVAKIASGRVIALNDQLWQYREAETALKTEKKYERTYGNYPVQVDETYKCADFRPEGLGIEGMGITVSCEDPVRAIKFLDYICSDEGQVLIHWGVEGITYEIDENGKRYMPEKIKQEREYDNAAFTKKYGIGNYTHPFPIWGDGVLDPTGNPYTTNTKEETIENYSDIEKEVLSNYGVEMWCDLYPDASEFVPSPYGPAWQIPITDGEMSTILAKCDDLSKQGIAKAVLSSPEDFDLVWDELQQNLKQAGVEKLEDYFTNVIRTKVN